MDTRTRQPTSCSPNSYPNNPTNTTDPLGLSSAHEDAANTADQPGYPTNLDYFNAQNW